MSEIKINQSSISDVQMIFIDCCGFVSGYFNGSVSMRSEPDFLDSNENKFDCSGARKSLPLKENTLKSINLAEIVDETSLLEELEIYPHRIQEKAAVIFNPFASNELAFEKFLADIDLYRPLFFCLLFGSCLFLAGKVFIFSHLYGLSMISVFGMYGLLKAMSYGNHEQFISIRGVASALGYGLLHLVWFSFFGIFMHLNTFNGFCFATFAIVLATFGASRILCVMSNQANNCALIAYPTAMVYILFAFLVTF